MSFLSVVDLGTLVVKKTGAFTASVTGSISYPTDLPAGSLVLLVGGQAGADTGVGGPLPTVGDGYGNVLGPHPVGGNGSATAPAAVYWSGVLDYDAPAGADLTTAIGAPLPGSSLLWVKGYAVTGAEGWSGGVVSQNGNPDPATTVPLALTDLPLTANPGGALLVQAGAGMVLAADGPATGEFSDTLFGGAFSVGFSGSVSEIAPSVTGPQSFSLAVDDRYTWGAEMVLFTPRFYKSGNVISLATKLGRVARAYQRLTYSTSGNVSQPDFNRRVESLGDGAHISSSLGVGSRCWSLSLGCREAKRWDLFACKEAGGSGNLLTPLADVIHQQSGNDCLDWTDAETVLSGRYHSVCHVLSGKTGLVLAVWNDATEEWFVSVGSSGNGRGDWTMSAPVSLVSAAGGQASLRQDGDGRYWFAYIETGEGKLRLLRCDKLGPDGDDPWLDITVDDGAVGSGYTGVNLGIKSRGLLVFHLHRNSRALAGGGGIGTFIGRSVASYSSSDPDELTFSETVPATWHVDPATEFPISPKGPGDLLPRGDGTFYWSYEEGASMVRRVVSLVLPDGSGRVV